MTAPILSPYPTPMAPPANPGVPQWQQQWPQSPAEALPIAGQPLDAQTQDSLEALHDLLGFERPAFSLDRAVVPTLAMQGQQPNGLSGPAQPPEPTMPEDLGLGDTQDPEVARALRAMYGNEFPLAGDENTDPRSDQWASWASNLWRFHSAGVNIRLHLVERNRLFRRGVQWVSAIGIGPWREPPKPRDSARVVDNMIAPALDQRVQILAEQRPGFRCRPENQDQKNLKKAEAQQVALEYQYDQQSMRKVMMELAYWAGTDGVSFGETYWDPDAGPWDQLFLPATDHNGQPLYDQNGVMQLQSTGQMPLGEVKTRCRRMDQVRVSSNASATTKPYYWVIRDAIPESVAVQEYGPEVLADMEHGGAQDSAIDSSPAMRMGYQFPTPDELLRNIPTVDRFTVYCDKSDALKGGLYMVVVGRKVVVQPTPLLWGCVPVFRWTDGSTDPSFYPQAIMEGWVDSQMRVNVLKSKWVESIRLNTGGKVLARENTLSTETLVGGTTTVIGVKGPASHSIGDMVQPFPAFSIGEDVKELLETEKGVFEALSGWNSTSRGQFESTESGRALLVIREQIERIFAPMVNAAAESMEEWAKITIAAMRWGYDTQRSLAVEGHGRPDLARAVTSDDFDGVANVLIEPETLMPLPRALRLFMLDDMYSKGLMTQQEYRRRLPFAFTQNIDTPDTDHYARAQRAVEALRNQMQQIMQAGPMGMMMPPNPNPPECPILWQDNEAIHQDALERQLILPDDPQENPPMLRSLAFERWMMLAQQSAMKAAGMAPSMGVPAGPPQGGQPSQPPSARPIQGTNPGTDAGNAHMMAGNDQAVNAAQHDTASRQP
ncbi:MAG: hypothetical protein ACR652_24370 [Methylocystis sp.]|uniref:hypothetical protein n=1 Tax=Methylocystis sp. TaxID=1911079 RepID=UPI003DA4F3D3